MFFRVLFQDVFKHSNDLVKVFSKAREISSLAQGLLFCLYNYVDKTEYEHQRKTAIKILGNKA
jgi:hypothetical protein